ncbi:uroporphyrinogen-III C-methyltransferase [Alkalihalobacterium bogoriense]|uniref:uroporphyrinogen-III C-methyltransferase n=1 Tax=Alkalihalobacterium bogoriense TaxID=246272 RepID=UPI0005519E77|nr:uroporphyrinogen-III C-methyltransferase [Alkalihalobacterium bogoriense]
MTGKVYLVGAGPGDIGLITVKGKECLQKAEVVLYDRLINPVLLSFVKPSTELIYCGKLPDRHFLRQEAINALLVEKALEGKTVVRLKGGDPSVFGRVGEEAEELVLHNIEYEIIPGVTSSIAAASYAGIPVTHREYGFSFAVVTGHDKSSSGKPIIDWAALAGIDTIAFYMGVGNIKYITEQLMSHQKSPDTPVILIQWGTYGRQKTLEGTLATISQKVAEVKFSNPAITLVGNIVALREKLAWFENKKLHGKQIIVARTGTGESELGKKLEKYGAEVVHYPQFTTVKKDVAANLIQNLHQYEQILFLSPESVQFFMQALVYIKKDLRKVQADFAVHSVKSERELLKYGCFSEPFDKTKRTLVVGTNAQYEAGDYGAMDFYETHHTEIQEKSHIILQRLLADETVNTIVFPSSAAVATFVDAVCKVEPNAVEQLQHCHIICYGQKSYDAAVAFGFVHVQMANEPTVDSVVEGLMTETLQTK